MSLPSPSSPPSSSIPSSSSLSTPLYFSPSSSALSSDSLPSLTSQRVPSSAMPVILPRRSVTWFHPSLVKLRSVQYSCQQLQDVPAPPHVSPATRVTYERDARPVERCAHRSVGIRRENTIPPLIRSVRTNVDRKERRGYGRRGGVEKNGRNILEPWLLARSQQTARKGEEKQSMGPCWPEEKRLHLQEHIEILTLHTFTLEQQHKHSTLSAAQAVGTHFTSSPEAEMTSNPSVENSTRPQGKRQIQTLTTPT
eukprot:766616-Hanusia_phi.AAC.4